MRRIVLMFVACFYRLPYLFYKLFKLSGKKGNHTKEEKYGFLHKNVVHALRGGRVTVKGFGLSNLPTQDGYIMISNHQGMFDAMAMIYLSERPFGTLSKKEAADIKILNRVLDCMGVEYIDREDIRSSLKTIQHVAQRVKEGDNFIIYPEGTRSKEGNKMGPFKPGAFKSATMAKCPIIPIAIVDSFIPFDRPSIKRTTVYVRILKPIPYEEYKDLKTTEISLMVQSRIAEAISNIEKKAARKAGINRFHALFAKH